ncbi:hypothetical protein ACFXKW_20960 [Streptomyces sp. NPDC059193]|uniref:hypothetical protein n=1 Tax=Streptomyces sp. NPDC059193 TaxID=3346763 RepID=UPI0036A6100D
MSDTQTPAPAPAATEYEAPTARFVGTLADLAAGSYSDGQSDDGDFSTVKWKQG